MKDKRPTPADRRDCLMLRLGYLVPAAARDRLLQKRLARWPGTKLTPRGRTAAQAELLGKLQLCNDDLHQMLEALEAGHDPLCKRCRRWTHVRRCRGCRCTDECACANGCSWVEPDLCSTCADLLVEPAESVYSLKQQVEALRTSILSAWQRLGALDPARVGPGVVSVAEDLHHLLVVAGGDPTGGRK